MVKDVINFFGRLILQAFAAKQDYSLREIPSERIDAWFDAKKIFFVLSIGRSGSMFLANFLNKASGNQVVHEPTRLDFLAYPQAYYGVEKGFDYFSDFRKKFIYWHNHRREITQYGEVNSLLRRHSLAVRENIPNAKLFHLVRDGRDVVRSMMARRTFTLKDPFSLLIHPKQGEDYYEMWFEMDRFERLCWYWWVENKYLVESIVTPIYFERIIKDFDYLKENLLSPLGLDISQENWIDEINQPKNSTAQHAIPHWRDWSQERQDKFDSICGSLMENLGYYGTK